MKYDVIVDQSVETPIVGTIEAALKLGAKTIKVQAGTYLGTVNLPRGTECVRIDAETLEVRNDRQR